MKLIFNIIGKDLRRLRVPLAFWILLMSTKLVFFAIIAGVCRSPHLDLMRRMKDGPEMLLNLLVEPLIAYFLVALMIYEDPLTDNDSFWVTRPISGRMLLAAKLIGVGLMFVAVPVLVNVPWWLACGFGRLEILASAGSIAGEYAFLVIIGIGCASGTNGLPRYVLWTITGIAAMATVHLVLMLLLGMGTGISMSEHGTAINHLDIFLLCMLLVAITVIGYQFLTHNLQRSMAVTIAAIVLITGLIRAIPALNPHTNPRDEYLSPPSMSLADGQRFNVRIDGKAYVDKGRGIIVPLTVNGLRGDEMVFHVIDAKWELDGTTVWQTVGFYGGSWMFRQTAIAGILQLSKPDWGPRLDKVNFEFPKGLVARITATNARFHGEDHLHVSRGRILSKMPLAEGSHRYSQGSFSISDIHLDKGSLSLELIQRFNPATNFGSPSIWAGGDGYYFYALVRHDDGKLIDTQDDTVLYPWDLRLNMVSLSIKKLSFKAPAGPGWINDADLVVVEFGGDHVIIRTLDSDPFLFGDTAPRPNYLVP